MRLALIALCAISVAAATPREQKAFSLFNVVTFKNTDCTSDVGGRDGVCYTSEECSEKGGTASGGCAMGFGTCCLFAFNDCKTEVNQNLTYIRNNEFPTAQSTQGTCNYRVNKCDENVCTLRLDFETFNILAGTGTLDSTSACRDTFAVSGVANGGRFPTICGLNTGEHMYIELGEENGDTATLEFTFADVQANRNFEIKVTQYSCSSPNRPPEGCLQYHTGTMGKIQTFNFAGNSVHLPSQNYKVCIRQELGFCCVKYSVCDADLSFSLTETASNDLTMVKALVDTSCTLDWIEIEGGNEQCNAPHKYNRFCGARLGTEEASVLQFSNEICDCSGPFDVRVLTNDGTDAKQDDMIQSRGVCLNYDQQACTGSK